MNTKARSLEQLSPKALSLLRSAERVRNRGEAAEILRHIDSLEAEVQGYLDTESLERRHRRQLASAGSLNRRLELWRSSPLPPIVWLLRAARRTAETHLNPAP